MVRVEAPCHEPPRPGPARADVPCAPPQSALCSRPDVWDARLGHSNIPPVPQARADPSSLPSESRNSDGFPRGPNTAANAESGFVRSLTGKCWAVAGVPRILLFQTQRPPLAHLLRPPSARLHQWHCHSPKGSRRSTRHPRPLVSRVRAQPIRTRCRLWLWNVSHLPVYESPPPAFPPRTPPRSHSSLSLPRPPLCSFWFTFHKVARLIFKEKKKKKSEHIFPLQKTLPGFPPILGIKRQHLTPDHKAPEVICGEAVAFSVGPISDSFSLPPHYPVSPLAWELLRDNAKLPSRQSARPPLPLPAAPMSRPPPPGPPVPLFLTHFSSQHFL